MTTPRRAAAPPSAAEQAGAVAEKHKAMLVRAATPLSTGVPIKASKGHISRETAAQRSAERSCAVTRNARGNALLVDCDCGALVG